MLSKSIQGRNRVKGVVIHFVGVRLPSKSTKSTGEHIFSILRSKIEQEKEQTTDNTAARSEVCPQKCLL